MSRERLRRGDAPGEEGSAVVAALALTVVLGILIALVTARAGSAVSASAGVIDRVQARALAEHALETAIAELGSGVLLDDVLAGVPIDGRVLLETARLPFESPRVRLVEAAVHGPLPRERITVEALAEVGSATHRASAVVRPHLSVDHVLLAEHGVVDPVLLGLPRAACSWLHDDVRRDGACIELQLARGEVSGPVHTNDGLASGPDVRVVGPVTTSLLVRDDEGTVRPAHRSVLDTIEGEGGVPQPEHRPLIALPRSTAEVLAGVDVTCRFRGPTRIRLDGPRMRVTSPRSVPRPGEASVAGREIGCLGIERAELGGVVVVTLPERAVIEVVRDDRTDCLAHPLGLGPFDDLNREWWCSGGDAFVWGRYRGSRTIVAEDHVQILWDLEPGDAASPGEAAADDLLGLVAGDSIVLRRPVTRTGRFPAVYGTNIAFAGPGIAPFGAFPDDAPVATASRWEHPRIHASLVALGGSVGVQHPFRGQLASGPLTVVGSVAGRFGGVTFWQQRGPDGSLLGEMGYRTELTHDPRLGSTSPPAMPVIDGGLMRILELDPG